jgi:hypothetical protein
MARSGRFGHASSVRCSQNRRCRIACRRGAYRPPTRAGLGAGCRAGRRPCADRNCRLNIGCCRSRDRRRAIPPGRQVGICLSLEGVVAAEPLRMIPRLLTAFSRPAQLRILRLEGTSLFRLRPPTTEDRKERGRQFSSAIVSGGFRVSFRAGLRSALASVLRRCRRE